MDRREWGEMLGDDGRVEDDLRWTLFQAERCIETIKREVADFTEELPAGRPVDTPVYSSFQRRARDTRVALAALWARQRPPGIIGM